MIQSGRPLQPVSDGFGIGDASSNGRDQNQRPSLRGRSQEQRRKVPDNGVWSDHIDPEVGQQVLGGKGYEWPLASDGGSVNDHRVQ